MLLHIRHFNNSFSPILIQKYPVFFQQHKKKVLPNGLIRLASVNNILLL